MDLVDSIPISDINSEMVKNEIHSHTSYFDVRGVKFKITDVNLSERDNNGNPLITSIARKKRVNVTISGHIDEPFKVSKSNLKNYEPDSRTEQVNINGKTMNLTFMAVRIIREKTFNESLQTVINVPRLMIDNTHELYGFLKPIYVNKGEMSLQSEKNIYLSFQELVELLKDCTVNLKARENENAHSYMTYRWITEYKKGDSNGDETH